MNSVIRIGVSGWRYPPWRGAFYPDGLRQADELTYTSQKLPTVEINGSFYSLQTPASYAAWYAATPQGFLFSVKGGRFITNMKRLRDIDKPLANFFASGIFRLKEKLGPVLWQFPPNMKYEPQLFADFIGKLPQDTSAALRLARRRRGRAPEPRSVRVVLRSPVGEDPDGEGDHRDRVTGAAAASGSLAPRPPRCRMHPIVMLSRAR